MMVDTRQRKKWRLDEVDTLWKLVADHGFLEGIALAARKLGRTEKSCNTKWNKEYKKRKLENHTIDFPAQEPEPVKTEKVEPPKQESAKAKSVKVTVNDGSQTFEAEVLIKNNQFVVARHDNLVITLEKY